jgi:hypothetical protein
MRAWAQGAGKSKPTSTTSSSEAGLPRVPAIDTILVAGRAFIVTVAMRFSSDKSFPVEDPSTELKRKKQIPRRYPEITPKTQQRD